MMSDATHAPDAAGGLLAYANPARFLRVAGRLIPVLWVLALALLGWGLTAAFSAPEDYQQGETVRIMFIHVPFAWLSMFIYMTMAVSALGTLIWRHPLADVSAKAALPAGAVFTALCLITGALWGRPMWGTYWVWDARLTSVFVLFLIYLGIIAIHRALDEPGRAARAAAIVTLVGAINLPIIKFSVDWWNTLHQPAAVFRMDGPTIHPSLLWPLMVMAIGFTVFFLALHLTAMRGEIWTRRAAAIARRMARDAEQG